MAIRLAIIGLDLIQQDWLTALRQLAARGSVQLVAAAHRTAALAKDLGDALDAPHFDDFRHLLRDANPQAILLDRPTTLSLDFLTTCVSQNIGIFSLGPPVFSLAEARALAACLTPRTGLLYVWPRLASTRAFKHCAQADEFVRPVKFAVASWQAFNHVLAKNSGRTEDSVRSLNTLAWDALSTLIDLMGLPESLYASVRGTTGTADNFADLSGAASLTLRFAEQGVASLSLSDRFGPFQRQLLLLGQNGSLRLDGHHYDYAGADGKLIDSGDTPPVAAADRAAEEFLEFLEQLAAPPSPHRGWEHRLETVAASLEALQVSHRTGQAELPERFLSLRR